MDVCKELYNSLLDMDTVAQALNLPSFDIHLLGGSACLLGCYTSRATVDFDMMNLNYPAYVGRALSQLRAFDLLDFATTCISPTYVSRLKKLNGFKHVGVYILSKEDVLVSKIIRLSDKDKEDINVLIKSSDKGLIRIIIEQVLDRKDLFHLKHEAFEKNVEVFRSEYDV